MESIEKIPLDKMSLAVISDETNIPINEFKEMIDWGKEVNEAETFNELQVVLNNISFLEDNTQQKETVFVIASSKLEELLLTMLKDADSAGEVKHVRRTTNSAAQLGIDSRVFDQIDEKWDKLSLIEVGEAKNIDELLKAYLKTRSDSEPKKKAIQRIYSMYKTTYLPKK